MLLKQHQSRLLSYHFVNFLVIKFVIVLTISYEKSLLAPKVSPIFSHLPLCFCVVVGIDNHYLKCFKIVPLALENNKN